MKIIGLNIENVKKIKAVEINPKDSTVLLTGKNAQGKSSILDSIFSALTGKMPADPIRHGEEKGNIQIDVGDYVIKKSITNKGAYLKVETQDGASYSSPQKLLDSITGKLSFDPLVFAGLKGKEQRQTLLQLIGVDFSDLERQKKNITEERTILGREGKQLAGHFESLNPDFEGIPDKEIDILQLVNEIDFEKDKEQKFEDMGDEIEKRITRINSTQSMIKNNDEEILDLKKQIAELESENDSCRDSIKASKEEIKTTEETRKLIDWDYISLEEKLQNSEIINQRVREKVAFIETGTNLENKRAEYKEKTVELEAIENQKAKALQKADMPIKGLSVNENEVVYNDTVFSGLSSAEKLKVSLAIAMKMNPKLKVILMKDGSLLDSDSLRVISEMVKDQDYQIWIEKVDESGKVGLFIENGEIKTNNYENKK